MKKTFTLALIAITSAASAQQKIIGGFTSASSAKELQTEQAFDASLSAPRIGETIKELSAFPHNVGSPGSKAVAEKILAKYKSYGLDAHLEAYTVLFPTPKTRVLELTGPTKYTALLKEPALAEDATSGQANQLPTYNAWSGDGDVTAPLVFVNYGLPDDYETLAKLGVDVKGKIVIAKYGRSWRGIKPKVAYEHGAVGCIIYSDPKDDGYTAGDVYPKGAYKNEYGVQRGSVMDMVIYPGDPLTPGVGATKEAKRLDRNDAVTILKIPVLPISYHDAQPLLAAMDGQVAPRDWQGGLPITYHLGAGKATAHLKMEFNWDMVTAYDVIAKIKGSKYPDEWVLRGNHHDAWVNGAGDPISGQSAMLDEAKALGDLLKTGWKPKRTIIYCSWDGEEPGLLGSTEFAEEHDKELQQKAVVYINSDGNGRGFLGTGGSQALEPFVDEITQNVTDPQTNVSVFDRRKAKQAVDASSAKDKKEILERKTGKLESLGSGSDYSSFLQHLGIPTLDIGYGGEDGGGEYHSIYDSFDDYRRFKDSSFKYGVALAQTAGHAVLRMADADLLPFDFRNLQTTIDKYVTELTDLVDKMHENTAIENQLIKANDFALAADPTKREQLPVAKDTVPRLDFTTLKAAMDTFKKAADKLATKWTLASQDNRDNDKLNKQLYQAEQQLLSIDGLPRRPWYRHTIYAPGFYTGYGVKTLPGIREAIEQRNWKEAQEQIGVVAASINKLSVYLNTAAGS
ncbi:transferrin receptor-like dimerization domain-containing protein [Mucilaginibacter sp. L3T2-6]|uniref:transferrin receptor-like dimerization domain-containing protein n=1 Tax=Mucilaginibacter sp. L3T2-6 TaxID=3062491 RepID=UPI0026772A46|nr:transferrin receptor-like dimerization domain-containing protein [Mucilaginibacter sp. L3T2-6]MDO3642370.1 transferrin receptor-like dimerization domain-containing protein [Mucilaginibacter sp. L3T2-6]MDV6214865.1 transferrin receptor-like dimerization domain-containing protein [Mucilaginibacter sp. L3T2-6]